MNAGLAPDGTASVRDKLPAEYKQYAPLVEQALAQVRSGELSDTEAAIAIAATTPLALTIQQNGVRFEGHYESIFVEEIIGGNKVNFIFTTPDADPYDVEDLKAFNPYLGLRAFTIDDKEAFAGREAAINGALKRIASNGLSLTFINGASGSGKSSFAQAGFAPALMGRYEAQQLKPRYAVMRPGPRPMYALAEAFAVLGLCRTMFFSRLPSGGSQSRSRGLSRLSIFGSLINSRNSLIVRPTRGSAVRCGTSFRNCQRSRSCACILSRLCAWTTTISFTIGRSYMMWPNRVLTCVLGR
ncbi:ATP-binding protein [Candidatus Gracilibacteria bacterium]|nr:ATP-binding protein [Candidatus Gracilibacteria bacterium]